MNVACQRAVRCNHGIYGRHGLYFFATYLYVSETRASCRLLLFEFFSGNVGTWHVLIILRLNLKIRFNETREILYRSINRRSIVGRQKRRATLRNINWLSLRSYCRIYVYIYIYFWEFEIEKSNGKLAFHRVSISMRFYLAFEYGLDGKLSYYRLTLTIALLFSTRVRSVGKKKKKKKKRGAWKRCRDCLLRTIVNFYFDRDFSRGVFFFLSFFILFPFIGIF